MNTLQYFKDDLARDVHGITVQEAHSKSICISCKEVVLPVISSEPNAHFYSMAGLKEYKISGMCERCFDKLFE